MYLTQHSSEFWDGKLSLGGNPYFPPLYCGMVPVSVNLSVSSQESEESPDTRTINFRNVAANLRVGKLGPCSLQSS